MFTLRGQTLCLLYSEMHPRDTTGTQKLSVKSIEYCCSEDVMVAIMAAILQPGGRTERVTEEWKQSPNTAEPVKYLLLNVILTCINCVSH